MMNFPDAPTVGLGFVSGAMSYTYDGVKWVAASGGLSGLSMNVQAPVTGATVTLTDFRPVYINNPGSLASLTIKLPPSPSPASYVEISFANPVSSLAMQNSAGVAVAGAPYSAYGPGAALEFRYSGSVWVYWK
jgi:hypothetical protein